MKEKMKEKCLLFISGRIGECYSYSLKKKNPVLEMQILGSFPGQSLRKLFEQDLQMILRHARIWEPLILQPLNHIYGASIIWLLKF